MAKLWLHHDDERTFLDSSYHVRRDDERNLSLLQTYTLLILFTYKLCRGSAPPCLIITFQQSMRIVYASYYLNMF